MQHSLVLLVFLRLYQEMKAQADLKSAPKGPKKQYGGCGFQSEYILFRQKQLVSPSKEVVCGPMHASHF